jgi:signal transduction histidine kinase
VEGAAARFLRIEVADTGVGIEASKLGQVFDLFSQADGSNTRRFGGAGLGLTLCRHLVQGMGGQIGIESDGPGRGTRAWFTLPVAAGVSRATSSPALTDQSRAA